MILCKTRKICILGPTKTGSTTLAKLFKDVEVDFKSDLTSQHYTFNDYVQKGIISEEDLRTYSFYSFYRNPMERFFSASRSVRRNSNPALMQLIMDGNYAAPASALEYVGEASYENLTQESRERLEKIPTRDVCGQFLVFELQKHWLDIPANLTLLDFSDFNNQASMLLSLFDISGVEIPLTNNSIRRPEYDSVHESGSIREYVKRRYKQDYDFFAEKGITFPE